MGHRSSLIAAIALAASVSAPAGAQTAAAASKPADSRAWLTAPSIVPGLENSARTPIFSPPAYLPAPAATRSTRPLSQPAPVKGSRGVRWRVDEVTVGSGNGSVDTLKLSLSEVQAAPIASARRRGPYNTDAFDLRYTRDWPDAVQFAAGSYDLALSPHAGLGLSSAGGGAEAGAMLRLEHQDKGDRALNALGVRDGDKYGDQSRWYLFAAASGRAVGLNMTRGGDGGWDQGWSTDKTSKLIGDGQLGVGYRKGPMQAAFGYVYREIKAQNGPRGADNDVSDSMAAFSLSIRP